MANHNQSRNIIVKEHMDLQSFVLIPFLFPYRTDHISVVQPTNRTGFVTVIRSSSNHYDESMLFAKQLGYKDANARVLVATGINANEKITCIRKLASVSSNPIVYPNLLVDLYESVIYAAKNDLLKAMDEFQT